MLSLHKPSPKSDQKKKTNKLLLQCEAEYIFYSISVSWTYDGSLLGVPFNIISSPEVMMVAVVRNTAERVGLEMDLLRALYKLD